MFTNLASILSYIDLSCLTNEQKDLCEIEPGEKELCNTSRSMPNSKTPENDGLSFEFYEEFWNKLRDPILNSFYHAKTYKEFSSSHRPAVIEFLDKKDRDKILINNWRPISLSNTDLNVISKALAAKLKSVLPSFLTPPQTAYFLFSALYSTIYVYV